MNKAIVVDITYRLTIEMAPGDTVNDVLFEMDADFAWPETQAEVHHQEVLHYEIVEQLNS